MDTSPRSSLQVPSEAKIIVFVDMYRKKAGALKLHFDADTDPFMEASVRCQRRTDRGLPLLHFDSSARALSLEHTNQIKCTLCTSDFWRLYPKAQFLH